VSERLVFVFVNVILFYRLRKKPQL